MSEILWVAAGGGVGSALRYLATRGVGSITDSHVATAVVNVTGSFVLGFLVGYLALKYTGRVRFAVGIGLLGGFTTFSTFALESVQLFREGEPGVAIVNIVGSVVVGLGAAMIGLLLGEAAA